MGLHPVKARRIPRPRGELVVELKEQLELLNMACEKFDEGAEAAGKHIGLTLRLLLHSHGQSRALLEQLGMRSGRFFDTAGPLNPRNLLTECNLVGIRATQAGGRYVPLVQMGGGPHPPRKRIFHLWWTEPVMRDNKRRTLSRLDLVSNVANTDGGAHVDPTLDEVYMAISRQNSLGWTFGNGDLTQAMTGRPELACMRQIAHEVLSTVAARYPEFSGHLKPG